MRLSRRRFLLSGLAGIALPAAAAAPPIWPGAGFSRDDRDRSIRRGLDFIYRLTQKPENFSEYGEDFLFCLYSLAATAADPWLKQNAWRMGRERARRWRRDHPRVPANANADEVEALVFGSHAADCLGIRDDAMKPALAQAARRFGAIDFLRFDPMSGAIPTDIPAPCEENRPASAGGALRKGGCTERSVVSPYELLLDALVTTYTGEHYGVRLGARLSDVTALVPTLRPYRGADAGTNTDFIDIAYAVTHIVYALNDYGIYRLRPEWLPQEFAFLKENLGEAIRQNDPETMGEFVDTLKAFGLTEEDPLIRTGMAFIMARQRPDGSWGDPDGEDAYTPYHATWTAINGLMDYAWRGERASFPEALRRARGEPAG